MMKERRRRSKIWLEEREIQPKKNSCGTENLFAVYQSHFDSLSDHLRDADAQDRCSIRKDHDKCACSFSQQQPLFYLPLLKPLLAIKL